MCKYTIRITGEYDILILSPNSIRILIEKIRRSDTKVLDIPAQALLARGYADYLANVLRANTQGDQSQLQKQNVYDLTAKQIQMLNINQKQCFDSADVIVKQNDPAFRLDTNQDFFFLTKHRGNRFYYVYQDVDGEEIQLCFVEKNERRTACSF